MMMMSGKLMTPLGREVLRLCSRVVLVRGHHQRNVRFLASGRVIAAREGSWSSLSDTEQMAWSTLGYTKDSWEKRSPPPHWKEWSDLNATEKSAAKHGLGVKDGAEWDALSPQNTISETTSTHSSDTHSEIPSLASLLAEEDESTSETSSGRALTVASQTRESRKKSSSPLARIALSTVKGLAPIVGPILRQVSYVGGSRGGSKQGLVLNLVGALVENIPSAIDHASGMLDVTGVDTLLYLDDSGSMQGSNLEQGRKALQSLESRLKINHQDDNNDARFLPTRIVKFGNQPLVLAPSDEDWNSLLVTTAWDGTSGGTYLWKMIEEDVTAKYRPAGGKLRVVVITDGADNLSPGKYRGVRGFDPLMSSLLAKGFDIEWHIIVVGNYSSFFGEKELSDSDQKLYQSLCRATGGQFLSVGANGWNENDVSVLKFLEAVEDSGYDDTETARRDRQKRYLLEARQGEAENFSWLPKLADKDEGDK